VITLGHPWEGSPTGTPTAGWVDNLALADDGNTLVGDLVGLPAWLTKPDPHGHTVLAATYPDRSVEATYDFRCQLGHTHPFVVTAVALLGAINPGVGTLSSLQDVGRLYEVAAGSPGGGTRVILSRDGRSVATSAAPDPAAAGAVDDDEWQTLVPASTVAAAAAAIVGDDDDDDLAPEPSWLDGPRDDDDDLEPAPEPGPAVTAGAPTGAGGLYARNPLVDQLRAAAEQGSTVYAAATAAGDSDTPTLFATGDLPVMTSSGLDPQALLGLPWFMRHRAATAASPAEVAEVFGDARVGALTEDYMGDIGNIEYRDSVMEWVMDGIDAETRREQRQEQRRAVQAANRTHRQAIAATADTDLEPEPDWLFGEGRWADR
jgi:hypothetical protein